MIVIVDYGLGNLSSIKNMMAYLGHNATISSEAGVINEASKLILPGVGSFDSGINNLNKLDLMPLIDNKVKNENCPILGICLGAQLMLNSSHEGVEKGFSFLNGEVVAFRDKFKSSKLDLPVPNMGWRDVFFNAYDQIEFHKSPSKFYFVHSFYFELKEKESEWSVSNYGFDFCSGFRKNNILGVQFHPEKSHKYGMSLLNYFVNHV